VADRGLAFSIACALALTWSGAGACGRDPAAHGSPDAERFGDTGEVGAGPPDADATALADGDAAALADGDLAEVAADPVPETHPPDLSACVVAGTDRLPIPEASGAALLDSEGRRFLLTADSGNQGEALIVDRVAGESRPATLPLGDGAGDDLEGLERAPDGRIWGLTSAGWLFAWQVEADGLALAFGPTPVTDDPSWRCEPFGVNCGANFEGLCLHPAPTGRCAGWAAAKATGELVCLVAAAGGGFRLDLGTRLAVTEPDRLSGCAYEPDPPHRLLAAGNLYSASAIWEVGEDGQLRELAERGTGNQEAILWLPGGEIQSFGDAQEVLGDESPRLRLECARAP
jgi:hypothetical protein